VPSQNAAALMCDGREAWLRVRFASRSRSKSVRRTLTLRPMRIAGSWPRRLVIPSGKIGQQPSPKLSNEQIEIRPATEVDADAVQRLRKHAWRARYLHPETGVTQAVLENELAVLPPTDSDLAHYRGMLADPRNRNFVAVLDGHVVGTVTYGHSEGDVGSIGVFVAEGSDGTGVGDALLSSVIASTSESLEVIIFARNPSREFYRRHGFREDGPEFEHHFREGVSLPVQRLRLERGRRPGSTKTPTLTLKTPDHPLIRGIRRCVHAPSTTSARLRATTEAVIKIELRTVCWLSLRIRATSATVRTSSPSGTADIARAYGDVILLRTTRPLGNSWPCRAGGIGRACLTRLRAEPAFHDDCLAEGEGQSSGLSPGPPSPTKPARIRWPLQASTEVFARARANQGCSALERRSPL